MDNNDVQIRAKNKVHFWTFVLFGLLVIGAGFEYLSLIRSLDQVTVIYLAHNHSAEDSQKAVAEPVKVVEEKVQEEVVVVEPVVVEEKITPEPQPVEAEKVESQSTGAEKIEAQLPTVDAHPYAAKEFLDYMQDMKDKVNAVTHSDTVLDKINVSEVKAEAVAPVQEPFEENKIQVYDEKKGVVDVIETPAEKTIPAVIENVAPDANEKVEPIAEAVTSKSQLSEERAIAEQIQQTVQNAADAVNETVQEGQSATEQAVQQLMDNVGVSEGEEKPIVLIPGLQAEQN